MQTISYLEFKNVEKALNKQKIMCVALQQNIYDFKGHTFAYLWFHSYTHADRAIIALKSLGYAVENGREKNNENAFFKFKLSLIKAN